MDVFVAAKMNSTGWWNLSAFVAVSLFGVVNKFLMVVVNVMVWDKHASVVGLACLLSTLVGGVVYQQPVTGG
ncbi:GDP-mannose transporter GONST4-like [Canna indica]|uniref:GDP-mannose transporter GONST4-like n=1 Tax=Canna indica TaxID=4628 RepID=A0AAQ3KPW5_9LILI|nr:GDP-mannose transporter GONST4-like [Canna indica]